MLIRFESSQSSAFVMQENVASALLRLIDRDTPEGAVTEEEIQDALDRLETSLQRLADPKPDVAADAAPEDADVEEEAVEHAEARINLRTRAAPLLDMLRRADKQDGYVMWRPD